MSTVTEPLPMSDSGWRELGYELPDRCPTHRCWTNQCQAGSHDQSEGGGA